MSQPDLSTRLSTTAEYFSSFGKYTHIDYLLVRIHTDTSLRMTSTTLSIVRVTTRLTSRSSSEFSYCPLTLQNAFTARHYQLRSRVVYQLLSPHLALRFSHLRVIITFYHR